jgi:hypothetical protein
MDSFGEYWQDGLVLFILLNNSEADRSKTILYKCADHNYIWYTNL